MYRELPKYKGKKGIPVMTEPGNAVKRRTGSWRVFKPVWNKEKCTKCLQCFLACPDSAITIDKDGYPVINYRNCKGCLNCVNVCKFGSMKKERDLHE
jgi:pyruvate ferredoxin oxidoreductase gamma subunit